MQIYRNRPNLYFNGLTRIYAMSDTHQEARNTALLLSKIVRDNDQGKDVIVLHAGDIAKGVYPINVEIGSFLKLKKLKPDIEIVMSLGNNDFGFNEKTLNKIMHYVKIFTQKGINIVCANLSGNNFAALKKVKPYTIVERDGDRTFITGFCINKICLPTQTGVKTLNSLDVVDGIISAIKKEKPDNVVILNHDFRPMSLKIINYCKQKGIKVDLLVEGHDHSFVKPDNIFKIYRPQAYSESMYKFDLINDNGKKYCKNVEMIKINDIIPEKELIKPVIKYEQDSELFKVIAKSVLNLEKNYSAPSSYGSFIADNMKQAANADIGFCSSGIIVKSLENSRNKELKKYDIISSVSCEHFLKTVDLTAEEMKTVFEHAYSGFGFEDNNSVFLQCSNNVKIVCKSDPKKKRCQISQIYIDEKPLLDAFGNSLNNKKYKCAIDSFIGDGGQGFSVLKRAVKTEVKKNNINLKLYDVLSTALVDAQKKYKEGSCYPHFVIEKI